MSKRSMKGIVVASFSMVVVAEVAGCAGDSGPLAPEMEDQIVLAAMEEAIQDEFRAELIYDKVLEDFGSVRPFSNIVNAEVRHSDAVAGLYVARGLPVPESRWSLSEIPAFSSITEACAAGVVAEVENAEIYERYLDLQLPLDVETVFEYNRRASLENHLPAFERCS